MPYALAVAEVYPMMNYKNAFTYISLVVGWIVEIAAVEIGLRIKRSQLKSRNDREEMEGKTKNLLNATEI